MVGIQSLCVFRRERPSDNNRPGTFRTEFTFLHNKTDPQGRRSEKQGRPRYFAKCIDLALSGSCRLLQKELLHVVPVERYEHGWHRVFLRVLEEGERFQEMDLLISGLLVLAFKEPE